MYENEQANTTIDSILNKSQFLHLDDQPLSFAKQREIYLSNIKRLHQEKTVLQE